MNIQVNGEIREVPSETSLGDVVAELNLAGERIAIELNQRVVCRKEWNAAVLQENDRIEIVHFVGGGSDRPLEAPRSE